MTNHSIYQVEATARFKRELKKIHKQHKDIEKMIEVVEKLSTNQELEAKYKNHKLVNDKYFKDCYECHIEPDWLLIYKIQGEELILLLLATGSHSDLFY